MSNSGERGRTPSPSRRTESENTPGQKAAQRYFEIFNKSLFISIFGEETVEKWTLEGGIDWKLLSDTSIPLESAKRRSNIRTLRRFLNCYQATGAQNPDCEKLIRSIMAADDVAAAVPAERAKLLALRYFDRLFPFAKMAITSKTGGVQLGFVLRILPRTAPDCNEVKYYVKTHAKGEISEASTAPKPFHPGELFVYRLLDELDVGCESHFFGRDERSFYIATRDANEKGGFQEYRKIKGDAKEAPHIWGVLCKFLPVSDERPREPDYQAIEAAVASDKIAQNFINQVTILDLLERLLLLSDLEGNTANFGFVRHDGKLPVLKVIDFRLQEDVDYDILHFIGEGILRPLLNSHKNFKHSKADAAIRYVLQNRPVHLKVAEAYKALNTCFANIAEDLERVKQSTVETIEHYIPREEAAKLVQTLETYVDLLQYRFANFRTAVTKYIKNGK
mmetsp:Transcript_23133/g.58622  ORF Transcript_23133/g.58622 Transcript_23133/m.58622 type:complete len:449 (+) Transcript_23133:135-1481(+)